MKIINAVLIATLSFTFCLNAEEGIINQAEAFIKKEQHGHQILSENEKTQAQILYGRLEQALKYLPADSKEISHIEYLLFALSNLFNLTTSADETQENVQGALHYLDQLWSSAKETAQASWDTLASAKSFLFERAQELPYLLRTFGGLIPPGSYISLLSKVLGLPGEATNHLLKELYKKLYNLREPSPEVKEVVEKAMQNIGITTDVTVLEDNDDCPEKIKDLSSYQKSFKSPLPGLLPDLDVDAPDLYTILGGFTLFVMPPAHCIDKSSLAYGSFRRQLYENLVKVNLYKEELNRYSTSATLLSMSASSAGAGMILLSKMASLEIADLTRRLGTGYSTLIQFLLADLFLAYGMIKTRHPTGALKASSRFLASSLIPAALIIISGFWGTRLAYNKYRSVIAGQKNTINYKAITKAVEFTPCVEEGIKLPQDGYAEWRRLRYPEWEEKDKINLEDRINSLISEFKHWPRRFPSDPIHKMYQVYSYNALRESMSLPPACSFKEIDEQWLEQLEHGVLQLPNSNDITE